MNFFLFYLCSKKANSHRFVRLGEEIKKRKLNFVPINLFKDNFFTGKGLIESKSGEKFNFNKNDFFLALSNSSETHYLIKILKSMGISNIWPSVNAINFSDKFYTSLFFNFIGVETPETVLMVDKRDIDKQIELVGGLPCVIKNVTGSEGGQVGIAKSKEEIFDFVNDSFSKWNNIEKIKMPTCRAAFIIQNFIKESSGSDYRVICIEDRIVGGIKRTSQTGDFRANISLGGKAEIFQVDNELAEISKKIMKEGELFYAGIDFIKAKDKWLAIEINTSAQFKGFEKATGINVAEKIVDKILEKSK